MGVEGGVHMKDEISFRYFYEMFKEEFRKNVAKLEMERIGKEEYDDLSEIFDMYITASLTKEERISIYDQILFLFSSEVTSFLLANSFKKFF